MLKILNQFRLGLVLLTSGGVLMLAGVAEAAPPSPGVGYHLQFKHSGMCLDNPSASTLDSTPQQQYLCVNYADNERWKFEPAGNDRSGRQFYLIRNVASGKCLNIAWGSLTDGETVVQYQCGQQWDNERFALIPVDDGAGDYYKLMAYHSKKCVNVAGASTELHAAIIQYECNGYWPQGTDNMNVRLLEIPK